MIQLVLSMALVALGCQQLYAQEVVRFDIPFETFRDTQLLQREIDRQGGTFRVGPSPNPSDVIVSLNVPENLPQLAAVQNDFNRAVGAELGDRVTLDFSEFNSSEYLDERQTCIPSADQFSWDDHLTSVKSQGLCQGCWAFGVMAAVEAHLHIVHDHETDGSEQFLIDCNDGRSSCTAGGWFDDPLRLLSTYGGVTEAEVAYAEKDTDCNPTLAPSYKVLSWGYVDRTGGIPSKSWMKTALCKYGPLSVSVKSTPLFARYLDGVFNEDEEGFGTSDVNHAVLLYGWNDSKRSWLIKNSWGPDWGEAGHMQIHYESNNIGHGATWADVVPVEGNVALIQRVEDATQEKSRALRLTASGVQVIEDLVDRIFGPSTPEE